MRQSSTQHTKLKVDLRNHFTTGNNHYPKIRQQTLHLLDKYSKTVTPKQSASEGTSFFQRGGGVRGRGKGNNNNNNNNQQPFDQEYWKDKYFFELPEKGHPSSHLPNKKSKEDDNNKSRTKASSNRSVKNIDKEKNTIK